MNYVVGIDLGGTNIKGGIVSEEGEIIISDSIRTPVDQGQDAVVGAMGAFAKELIEKSGKQVVKGGVGSPGPLSQEKGEIYNTPNFPGWVKVPVIEHLNADVGIPFTLENDANAACLGEKLFGAGKDFDPIVHLTLGTGIGGGVFIDGRLFRGPSGAGAELGHQSLDPDGPLCGCGARGCLEAFSADSGIRTRVREGLKNHPDSSLGNYNNTDVNFKVLNEERAKGDAYASELYDSVIYMLGIGIKNLVNIFNPQAVILSGGMIQAGEELFTSIDSVVRENAFSVLLEDFRILASTLGNNTGVLGAAACAIRN